MDRFDEPSVGGRHKRAETIDRISGSLVNVILGALILWVGQTTFRHAGLIAGFDQKFSGVGQQFTSAASDQETLRSRIDRIVNDIGERTRSRFTREDAEKLALHVKEIGDALNAFERQIIDRLNNVQLKVISLETNGNDYREIAALRAELTKLRSAMQPPLAPYAASTVNAVPPRVATSGPVYLPPVSQPR